VVINAAGANQFKLLQDQDENLISKHISLNLIAPILLIRRLIPLLLQKEAAQIMNIGSTLGSIGLPGYSVYSASKFGLRGFTEALRRELHGTAITVKYFAPRATNTTINSDNVIEMNKALGNAMDEPETIASAILAFIASNRTEQFFWLA
jgi:short-subunit dehydrogenase